MARKIDEDQILSSVSFKVLFNLLKNVDLYLNIQNMARKIKED